MMGVCETSQSWGEGQKRKLHFYTWVIKFIKMSLEIKKLKLVGLHQTTNLLHIKGYHQQNEKATFGMEANICKSYSQ